MSGNDVPVPISVLWLLTAAGVASPARNNVSVPISASEVPYRLQQPRIGTRDNLQAMPQSGVKNQTRSLSLYPTHSQSVCW
ncbi:MAG: hypothetical protein GX456_18865 [Verrucomicrobia bacterium]|nr:hypothetical protein [Verrucomicrobiota bacterium]